jgi:Orsellinic acid/F9775 biosynthesis cluster protein D
MIIHCGKICTFDLLQILFLLQNMSYKDIQPYITHLSAFQVVLCHFCKACIPPNDPLWHYKENHNAKKNHYIPVEIWDKIANYMATLDLCQPKEVYSDSWVPELKVIKEGFRCNFPGCRDCQTSESSMRTHYYTHQECIPKDFKNWESTALQTFFDGQHKK